ncbi:MAG: IS4 family transposase [Verrucomicrobia bacterium]|nr:IS4 family transposase [Verrucomicrobiota bacterium]
MARTKAGLGPGIRLTDFISLGVLGRFIPVELVRSVLARLGRQSIRQRDLPAEALVYYIVALGFYAGVSCDEVLRCLSEGIEWVMGQGARIRLAGKSAISQGRRRLGSSVMEELFQLVARPLAIADSQEPTLGAWYRQWQVVSLDGTTLEVADTEANRLYFGRPGASRGRSAFPQLRAVGLVESGTHSIFGAQAGPYDQGELTLARTLTRLLKGGMLCLADRNFLGYEFWQQARSTGADLLWRAKKSSRFDVLESFEDGSYRSYLFSHPELRRRHKAGQEVRVIDYELKGVESEEPFYRVVTSILDPRQAPAEELATVYSQRWELENALDELKTHLRGPRVALRSKTPQLVFQEFYGLLLAHFCVRSLMHEAAHKAREDPDRLSFTHCVQVIRRKLPISGSFSPSGSADLPSASSD